MARMNIESLWISLQITVKSKISTLLWRITENDLRTILGDTKMEVGIDQETNEPTDNFWENLKFGCPDATIDENTDFNDILKLSFKYFETKIIMLFLI